MHEKFLSELVQFGIRFSQLSGDLLGVARPAELTPTQFEILQIIAHDQGATLSSICECSKISLPNGSRELRKLRDLGLVVKGEVSTDKRLSSFALTQEGQQMIHNAYQRLAQEAWGRYGHFEPQDLDHLAHCLATLREKL